MSGTSLNILQKLMRRWDAVHPYNAAQVMKLAGVPDADAWRAGWRSTLSQSGLGALRMDGNRYEFQPMNGHMAAFDVRFATESLCDHLSTEINRPFADADEPPFRPFIIRGEACFYAGLVYQHWLADSASIRMLMRQWFVRVYDPDKADPNPMPLAQRGIRQAVGPLRGGWTIAGSAIEMGLGHLRMRRVQKIDSAALGNHSTRFDLVPARDGLIEHVRACARARQVKVNDIFLAALIQACVASVPLQPRKKRTDVAVGSVVDLRPWCPESLAGAFGLLLGFTNVICQPCDQGDFNRVLECVRRQTHRQKKIGVAPASLVWMTGAFYVGKLSKPSELYHFYRKELPLAGGISNVDLTNAWPAEYQRGPLLDYIRVSPTGPMTPIAITTTTLGSRFHLGVTYRTGLLSPERARAVAGSLLSRLESL